MPSIQDLAPRICVILMGPTGAGKTALSLELAKKYDGEIINADSRQIYVGMDIGTAKPPRSHPERGERRIRSQNTDSSALPQNDKTAKRNEPVLVEDVPHYLIDILTPGQRYSAAEFRDDARKLIADIQQRRKLPIVVGGTGFYVRALTGERELPNVPPDPLFRAWADGQPLDDLVEELRERAPDLLAKVDNLKNRQRVTRYLEIARGRGNRQATHSGHSPSWEPRQPAFGNRDPYAESLMPSPAFFKLALIPPRELLHQRIETRVREMLQKGFVEETRKLMREYGEKAPGLQTVGYTEVMAFLRGEFPESELEPRVVRAHKDYARRQLTWLKKEPNVIVVESPEEARKVVREHVKSSS